MAEAERPLRADARRNRERILASAGELFARQGNAVQMEEIAAHSGLGMGTLYRHFPSKRDLLVAVVRERFQNMSVLAREAESIADPGVAFETVLHRYLETADGDSAFQLALLGSTGLQWDGAEQQKAEFAEIVTRIIARAVAAGHLRADFTFSDFPVLACGIMSTMYFRPSRNSDWRRHLDLVLNGIRADPARSAPAHP
ncbi:Transcriptional regulator [Frankia canadensis]|uniref:Transcriptional regulator n=1 Tax=Frankia canadensis TaxID=1836972 RepID=A0A2I2KNC2_9ACTN|nr:TetR/AcrR family transcriptional regulator [Frankia canadensis]SNQ47160.1 Transcriptional regulator [Frankia canadensis]SOU54450.1 Transcriptional regulator [Frankia canadensis]